MLNVLKTISKKLGDYKDLLKFHSKLFLTRIPKQKTDELESLS